MEEHTRKNGEAVVSSNVTLKGLYLISVKAVAIGVAVVLILNMATPTEFMLERFAILKAAAGSSEIWVLFTPVLILLVVNLIIVAPFLLILHYLLRPVARCLKEMAEGVNVEMPILSQTRRRIINLPFIIVGIHVGMWVLFPSLIFFASYQIGFMDLRTAVVFAIRASMVGFITSSVAFYHIEAYCRKELIPLFFPDGHLAGLRGSATLPIGRRIHFFYSMGIVLPLAILLVTLITVQWEMTPDAMSSKEYGRRIIIFVGVLASIFLAIAGVHNRLVIRSIVEPLKNILSVNARIRRGDYQARIQVVGNDEIGILGDSGNAMIMGLAERQKLRSAFGRYVTPEIRDEILADRIPLEGQRVEGTVMFADLENFTPFVENNPPEEVMRSMRSYFTRMQQAIRQHRGLVIQFVGDEIEAVFGVPVPFENHADAAVAAALEMRHALEVLNQERAAEGKGAFAHGIGIHSGSLLAGNSGSEEQSAYSLIGNTVNVAARIEGLTREIMCDILISEATAKQLIHPVEMEQLTPRLVKGYSKPITVYRLL